jgi:hypothetical protein
MSFFAEFRARIRPEAPFAYLEFRQPGGSRSRSQGDYYVSEYAAKLICSVLHYSGFERKDQLDEAVLIVGSALSQDIGLHLNPGQRTNHYSKTFSLGSKEGYHLLMTNVIRATGNRPDFYPETYMIPIEREPLKEAFEDGGVWIVKPTGGARGNGIRLTKEIPRYQGHRLIVQRYVSNPLLINQLKFDLRFYVAVTSLDPLRVYLFDNGLVRLATQPYEEHAHNLEMLTAHLTNYHINKDQDNFAQGDEDGQGNRWSHAPFWPYLEALGADVPAIKAKIDDAAAEIMVAAAEPLREQPNHRNAFELFGIDVMLDAEYNIHVLEVNVTPALGTPSALDMAIKAPLVSDFFNLALVPKKGELMRKVDALMLCVEGDQRGKDFIGAFEFEAAEERLGGFRRVFPTVERVELFAELMNPKSKNDEGLHGYLKLTDEQKAASLAEGFNAWKEWLTRPPPPPAPEPEAAAAEGEAEQEGEASGAEQAAAHEEDAKE